MNPILTNELKEETFIRLYFSPKGGNFHYAGIKRAYLDFNRTLPIKDKNMIKREEKREETIQFLIDKLKGFISTMYNNQELFDTAHKELCYELKEQWDELTIGQAQKWINMTLKYWLLMGNTRIGSIDTNAMFFHIPIDSYVLKGMLEVKTITWSKISNYEEYLELQKKHREKNTGNPPIIDEICFFNKTERV